MDIRIKNAGTVAEQEVHYQHHRRHRRRRRRRRCHRNNRCPQDLIASWRIAYHQPYTKV